MITRELLLVRLSEIAQALERSGHGVALLGAGSSGLETDRLDAYSDLDFLAVVEEGHKDAYVRDLGWLEAAHPIAYAFKNTPDGYKVLFEDGIFAEFGVMEAGELKGIPFAPTRIIWKSTTSDFDDSLANGSNMPTDGKRSLDWLVGEILTNLFVGLSRYRRGEKLNALRMVQGFAIDRIIELAMYIEPAQTAHRDVFAPERRFEARFPGLAARLPSFMQGYDRTPESALAILDFIGEHFEINDALKNAILALAR